jgi:hypothetical protein
VGRRPVGIAIIAAVGVLAVLLGVGIGALTRVGSAVAAPSASPRQVANASGGPGPESAPPPSPTPSPSAAPTLAPTATPTPPPTVPPVPTATPEPTPSPTPGPTSDPLTGEIVPFIVAERRPIAVMIDDLSPARPQSGLSSADIVWHAPAEGGIPRYMAIFQTDLETAIGPVRSARSYYVAWATEFKAVYAHAGGSPQALATLRSRGRGQYVWNAEVFRWEGRYFHRSRERYAPHNVYTDGKTLRKLTRTLGAKDGKVVRFATFLPDAPDVARPYGGRIRVTYRANTVTYRYHHDSNTYRRTVSVEGAQVDAANGERVAPKNVIVMVVPFAPIGDKKHRLEADLIGSGKAWISTNGRTIVGTWKKGSQTKPTRFYDRAGNRITLTVGQTFIQVVPSRGDVSFEAGTEEPPAE